MTEVNKTLNTSGIRYFARIVAQQSARGFERSHSRVTTASSTRADFSASRAFPTRVLHGCVRKDVKCSEKAAITIIQSTCSTRTKFPGGIRSPANVAVPMLSAPFLRSTNLTPLPNTPIIIDFNDFVGLLAGNRFRDICPWSALQLFLADFGQGLLS